MNKLISVFASVLLATSLFVATASAIEIDHSFNNQIINSSELQKCLESGRAGCR